MSEYPLCVSAPVMGLGSETYIRRHVNELLPGRTAAISFHPSDPATCDWAPAGPHLIINSQSGRARSLRAAAFCLGFRASSFMDDWRIAAFLRTHRVQAVLGEFVQWTLPLLGATRSANCRLFVHAHGYDVSARTREPNWNTSVELLNLAAGVLVVSDAMKSRLVNAGVRRHLIHTVPCCPGLPPSLPQRVHTGATSFLSVGRMVGKKGPILALDAFRRLLCDAPGTVLHMVGSGPLLPAVHHYVQAVGLRDTVTLHGAQPHRIVLDMMGEASVFIQHSVVDPVTGDEEGLPVAILEAMAAALPVVSTAHAGIPEVIQHGQNGFLVDAGDTKGMAHWMLTLARDPELRHTIGLAARRTVSEQFTWAAEKNHLLRLLGLDDGTRFANQAQASK